MSEDPIIVRKDQHLDVVLQGRGRHARDAGFDAVRFVHEALPDLDHAKIDLGADFLGRRLKAPLLISSMTGGPARAGPPVMELMSRGAFSRRPRKSAPKSILA